MTRIAIQALTRADRVENGLESSNNDETAIRNGEKLDVPYESVHTALYALSKKLQTRQAQSMEEAQQHLSRPGPLHQQPPQNPSSCQVNLQEQEVSINRMLGLAYNRAVQTPTTTAGEKMRLRLQDPNWKRYNLHTSQPE